METINKALESRINKMIDLAFEIQTLPVAITDSEEVMTLRKLGTDLSVYINENISPDDIASFDLDIEVIDEIFTVVNVSGINITTVNLDSLKDLQKDRIVNYIYTLENLKKLLIGNIKDYVDELNVPEVSQSKALAVVEPKGELVAKETSTDVSMGFSNDIMEQFMYQQVSNAIGNNPMIQMILLQKQQEGKLNKAILMKLLSMAPSGYVRGGMESVMLMNVLNNL